MVNGRPCRFTVIHVMVAKAQHEWYQADVILLKQIRHNLLLNWRNRKDEGIL